MTADDFGPFFEAIHGVAPFPWQTRLAQEVANRRAWPEAILVPTGCGKTAVVEIAVFSLALDSSMPRRIFFVVDRRLVVDQAYERAQLLARALEESGAPAVRSVADRLLQSGASRPLTVSRLRGGLAIEERLWCEDPRQPTVVTSTVDQIGSRLLFRGYGCSDSRRPIEAGLVANDSLIVVDEAHISQPFLDTLAALQSKGAPIRWCQMSATPRNGGTPFVLTSDDVKGSAELRRRISARKLARLTQGKSVAQAVVREALDLAKDDQVNVVGVVVNSVADARRAFHSLQQRSEAVLLTGRVRPHDRDLILTHWLPRMRTGRDYASDRPLFVVATQTIEVGADLDFDALVTEAAPIDVLRQRFGRLDRLGRKGESRGAVVRDPKKDSPVYGEATAKTWAWMSEQRAVDFGPEAMAKALGPDSPAGLLTPAARAPQLLRAHLNAWIMTRPAPQVDPAVGPFLHGPDALDSIEVYVAWRADLSPDTPEQWSETVELAPPQPHELMPVPIGAALSWLSERPALIWRGDEPSAVRRARPGETLVVPSEYGGCDAFGWAPDSDEPVEDVADTPGLWRRLHPKLLNEDQSRTLLELLRREDVRPKDFEAVQPLSGKPLSWQPYPDRSGAVVYLRNSSWEDDPANLASRPVLLSAHLASVAAVARDFAAGIPEAQQIETAARLHDLGKLDPRFQTMLHGGREAAAARAVFSGAPLAKSAEAWSLAEYRRILLASRYPARARHEAASTLLAEGLGADELTLHLIAAHHGWARPAFLPWEDEVPLEVRFEERDLSARPGAELSSPDSSVGTRFWDLNQALGPWRLAFLEAVLRLADQRCSREEATGE